MESFIVCLLAIVIRLLLQVQQAKKSLLRRNQERVVNGQSHAVTKFNLKYFFKDNILRIIIGTLFCLVLTSVVPSYWAISYGEWTLLHTFILNLVVFGNIKIIIPKLDSGIAKYLE